MKYYVFENIMESEHKWFAPNIMENGAFALLKQMLNFPQYFQSIQNLTQIIPDFF